MKSGGSRDDDLDANLITPRLDAISERSISFDVSVDGSNTMDEDMNADFGDDLEGKADDPMGTTSDTAESAILSAGRSGGTRSLARNLADEPDDVADPDPAYDDCEDDNKDSTSPVKMTQVTEQTTGKRPPVNELWKWKEKLRRALGVTGYDSGSRRETHEPVDRSCIPLPKTPNKSKSNAAKTVFSATGERSPYFQDSHMVIPRSTSRSDRAARSAEESKTTIDIRRGSTRRTSRRSRVSKDSSDSDEDYTSFAGYGEVQMDEYLVKFAR
ncbi:hypothetical protein PC117_g25350 [Phytophthora cactorum]|uniref:Uncharacterized protein n=1 Tax=Phytophthora cactorum TaxID=29920 RepID=A0A8T1ASP4_9STRA|nr:hypothetical protein PC117_g25350 [Phytophthora cactorum]